MFKSSEADRKVEESLARMMGEEASYLRPMDAGDEKIGPLVRSYTYLIFLCFPFHRDDFIDIQFHTRQFRGVRKRSWWNGCHW